MRSALLLLVAAVGLVAVPSLAQAAPQAITVRDCKHVVRVTPQPSGAAWVVCNAKEIRGVDSGRYATGLRRYDALYVQPNGKVARRVSLGNREWIASTVSDPTSATLWATDGVNYVVRVTADGDRRVFRVAEQRKSRIGPLALTADHSLWFDVVQDWTVAAPDRKRSVLRIDPGGHHSVFAVPSTGVMANDAGALWTSGSIIDEQSRTTEHIGPLSLDGTWRPAQVRQQEFGFYLSNAPCCSFVASDGSAYFTTSDDRRLSRATADGEIQPVLKAAPGRAIARALPSADGGVWVSIRSGRHVTTAIRVDPHGRQSSFRTHAAIGVLDVPEIYAASGRDSAYWLTGGTYTDGVVLRVAPDGRRTVYRHKLGGLAVWSRPSSPWVWVAGQRGTDRRPGGAALMRYRAK